MSDSDENSIIRLFQSEKSIAPPPNVVTSQHEQTSNSNMNKSDAKKSFADISKEVKRHVNECFFKTGIFPKVIVERTQERYVVFNDVKNILSKVKGERTDNDITDLAHYFKDNKFFQQRIADNEEDFGNEESRLQSLKMCLKVAKFIHFSIITIIFR